MDDMDDIVREFLVESHENLDQLDQDLVALESTPGARDLLSSVFRTIHTIKGTSGFLAYGRLERVTHAGESLLVELRDGRRTMDGATTTVLLRLVDTVREILDAVEKDGTEGDVAVDDVIAAIADVQALGGVDSPVTVPAVTAPVVAEPAVTDAPAVDLPLTAAPVLVAPVPEAAVTNVPLPAAAEPAAPVPTVPDPVAPAAPSLVAPAAAARDEPVAGRSTADSSIRVDVDLLDQLMRQVGELVLARNQISRLATAGGDLELTRTAQRLNVIARELQEGVMKTRMQPIDHIWAKMPRVVRDLSTLCDRQVRLELVGGETELDRGLLEAVKDPLTHLVRNAVDHGIESPAERVAAGKPAQGVLAMRAFHAGGQVVVEVSDDGRGIDHEKVAATALRRGLRTAEELAGLSPAEVVQLLFLPGFSTADAVTNVSGRGVGMDVVRTRIEGIGGTVDVETVVGRGTSWRLRIPLTLAIMPALTIESAGDVYAIPQVNLLELVALDDRADVGVERVHAASVYRLRGELLPLLSLAEVLGVADPAQDDAGRVIAVVQADQQRFGLLLDRVLNTEEIVVKPLARRLKPLAVYAGATVLGDGRVALILDVQAIARRALPAEAGRQDQQDAAADGPVTVVEQLLVVGIGGGRRVALPLASVARLEHLRADQVELVGGREVVQYRGTILPLVRLGRLLGAPGSAPTDELVLAVYSAGTRSVGLVVDAIIDIVDDDHTADSDLEDAGLVGSTVLGGHVTELLDVRAAVLSADPAFYDPAGSDVAGTDAVGNAADGSAADGNDAAADVSRPDVVSQRDPSDLVGARR